jgi:hypothetical protein
LAIEAIRRWLKVEKVALRHEKLAAGHDHWRRRFVEHPPEYPGTPYILLHSLSHALMTEIAPDCGYPASSLKERVYALMDDETGVNKRPIGPRPTRGK